MTKITDRIKIDVTITAAEALKARVVLGRTNGSFDSKLFWELSTKLDPNNLFDPFHVDGISSVDYLIHKNDYEGYFFGLYDKQKKLVEIEMLERESLELASRISKLKREIGE